MNNFIKKNILFIMLLSLNIFANEVDFKKLIEPKHQEYVEKILDSISTSDNLTVDTFFERLKNNTQMLDTNNVLTPFLEEQKNIYDNKTETLELVDSFTIFYFVSETTSLDLIRNFSHDIEKLKEIEPSIKGLVLTRGLIGGDFDSMAKYVQNLQNLGIKKIEYTFHPWAFKYFELEKVPAYAMSYCKPDFRFKTCEHKYLVRGELSLTNFFEYVSDDNEDYKKYFFKLIEAK